MADLPSPPRKKRSCKPTLNADGTPATGVHLQLSAALYDRTFAAARRERMTVQEWIRKTLGQAVTPGDKPGP